MRVAFLVAVSLLAACGDSRPPLASSLANSNAPPASGGGVGPVNGKTQEGAADAGAAIGVAPTSSAEAGVGTGVDGNAAPAAPPSCAALASGGAPASLDNFTWGHQIAPGQGSDVWDFVWIENGCTIRYQHTNAMRSATLAVGDCAARAWVTNQAFLDVLRTGAGCPYLDGSATETFELMLTTEGRVARKTYLCDEPTVSAERACLADLVKRLFPTDSQRPGGFLDRAPDVRE
jgi:hypothetical protein